MGFSKLIPPCRQSAVKIQQTAGSRQVWMADLKRLHRQGKLIMAESKKRKQLNKRSAHSRRRIEGSFTQAQGQLVNVRLRPSYADQGLGMFGKA